MIEIKMSRSLPMSAERQARLIIQMWQEARLWSDDPDVRVVARFEEGDIVVVYDGTSDLPSLVQDLERQVEGPLVVQAAGRYHLLLRFIKEMHRLAQTFEEAVSLDVHGHTITVHPEDDPVTLCEEYLSQWEW
jgi:hypothetical protein